MMYLFQDRATDVYAFTVDPTGRNLPRRADTHWHYLETLDPARLAWGKEQFEKVRQDLRVWGWFAFHGQACPSSNALRL